MSDPFDEILAAAIAAADQGATEDALLLLRQALVHPGCVDTDPEWRSLLALLARLYSALGNTPLAAAAARGDATGLHQLGSAQIAAQQPAIAATLLLRAHALAPGDEAILAELAAAFELLGHYAESRRHLAAANPTGFLPRYLLAFATLMTGDTSEARHLAARLAPRTADDGFMQTRLTEIFARIDAIGGAAPSDRRGWHYALTGGFLLHTGDHKPDARIADTPALWREGIIRFAAVAEVLHLAIPRVLAFENPDSRTLGAAFGDELGVPVEPTYLPEAPGLFIAHDLSRIIPEVLGTLRPRVPGLTVFSHAAQATREQPLAADITTLHYGTLSPPGPSLVGMASDAEAGRAIAASPLAPDALADLPALLALAAAGRDLASACRTEGVRARQWRCPST